IATDYRKVQMCEPDSPDRCQGVHKTGQCKYRARPSSKHCYHHGAIKDKKKQQAKLKTAYQLAKWQSTVDDFANDDQVKSLRREIGIQRMVLEAIVAKCHDHGELMMQA